MWMQISGQEKYRATLFALSCLLQWVFLQCILLSCSDCMSNPEGKSRRIHDWTQMTSVSVSVHQGVFRLGSTALERRGSVRRPCLSEGFLETSAPGEHDLLCTGTSFLYLSQSTDISVGELTPTAHLCVQAGLPGVKYSCPDLGQEYSQLHGSLCFGPKLWSLEATHKHRAAVLSSMPLSPALWCVFFWSITILSDTMTEGKQLPCLDNYQDKHRFRGGLAETGGHLFLLLESFGRVECITPRYQIQQSLSCRESFTSLT